MEQFVSQIVGSVVNILTGHIMTQLRHVTSSTKRIADIRTEIEVLNGKSKDVNEHIERNKRNNKEIPARVEGWLGEVGNVNKEVRSISTNGIGCLNIKKRYRAGRSALKTSESIQRLINEEKEMNWSDANRPFGRVESKPASPSGEITQNDFKSRDEKFKKALEFLQQDGKTCQVIALCGMPGVGKTTMMEQLKKVVDDMNMFRWIVKVVIEENCDMLSIQKDIAVYICDEGLPEASVSVRADLLNKKFLEFSKAKQKTLVILDDVWENIKLKDIGLRSPLPDGVTLLLTSRDSNVCTKIAIEVDSVLQLVNVDVLEEAEAQNFFSQITGASEEDDRDMYLIGCDIVKRCGYLPFAIKVIASTLKSQGISVWRNALDRLNKDELHTNVQETINISCEHIEEEEMRIFLHCGLFPKDYDIPIEDLTRHAWGVKLLKNVSTLREARDRTITCVERLKNANLLMHSDRTGCVKMHDLVHSFVLGRVSKGDNAWIINHGNVSKWDRKEKVQPCERISLKCGGLFEFPRDVNYPNLSHLQLMHGDVSFMFPEDFYENMENLKVMSYYKMQYPLLPRSFQCSTNLISLCLSECKLMFDCSFIGDLVNLEVLSFARCGIRKLPYTIGKLKKLKLLDLTGCVELRIDDGVFKNLEYLEELYMKSVRFTNSNFEELQMLSSKLCALEVEFMDEKTQLKNLAFTKLYKFKISLGCELEEEDYERDSFKNTLKLVPASHRDLQDNTITELFYKTEKLYLQVGDMIGLEDVVSIHQHTFCNLRELEVSKCVNLKYLFPMCVASGLRKLERLTVMSCSALEALVHDNGRDIDTEGEMIKLEKLKFLSLQKLPKLASLFLVDNVVELPQLVELEVDGLPNFTSIYPDYNDTSALQNSFFNSQVNILVLSSLKVKSMEKLMQIWPHSSDEEINNMSMLRVISVVGCQSLVNLFPTNPMKLLNHLERLVVKDCDSIEVIFNIDLGCVGAVEQVSNNSLRSIKVEDSNRVREVWRIKGGENNSTNIPIFEAVESIEIICCTRFRSLFTPTDTKRLVADISLYDSGERGKNKELIKVVSGEEIPEVVENLFNIAFPLSLIPTFPHQLSNLNFSKNEMINVVFETSNEATRQDTQQQVQLFPYLKKLRLEEMERMTHVWKPDNWNKSLILQKQPPRSSFHNLTTIEMLRCNRIKYLFSPLMTKLFPNLEKIDISSCKGIEEVVSNRDDKSEDMTTSTNTHTITTNFFPRLHSLYFRYLKNLKHIGGVHDESKFSQVGAVSWSLCQYSKEITVESCEVLSSVIPSYAVGQMQNLQVLKVYYCSSLTEVFETQVINHNNGGGGTNIIDEGNGGTISRLENINVPQLSNLKTLVISSCRRLQLVFTFSTLESLKVLEELTVTYCYAMKVIVKEENGEETRVVMFPHLKSLELVQLPELEGFFLGKNEFQWPSLEKVKIAHCPKMRVFTSGQSTTKKLEYMHTSLGKHSLECGLNFPGTTKDKKGLPSSKSTSSISSSTSLERLPAWSFHNLIVLHMQYSFGEVKFPIPSNELLHWEKLESIQLSFCYHVEEVFEGTNSVVEIPNLRQLELKDLKNLKYIWKSNHHLRAVFLFPSLATLSINNCKKLEHVFTSSMLGSLLRLKEVHITRCPTLKVIIVKEEELEFERDAKVNEVVLPCLKSLKLEELRSLKGFCLGKDDFSLPLLDTLEIMECPEITVFTNGHLDTPALNIIDTSFGRCYVTEGVNSFIETKKDEGFQFSEMNRNLFF